MKQTSTTLPHYRLKLFITGASPNSIKAINNIQRICEQYLQGRYTLEVVDIYQQPDRAKLDQVVAIPLLIKTSPLPVKRLIGNMSDKSQVMKGLALTEEY